MLACAQRDNQTAEKALDAAVNVYTEWIALEPSEYCNEVLYGRAGYLHSLLVSIQGVRRAWDWKVDNVGGEESVLYVKMKNAEDVAGQVARELIQIGRYTNDREAALCKISSLDSLYLYSHHDNYKQKFFSKLFHLAVLLSNVECL